MSLFSTSHQTGQLKSVAMVGACSEAGSFNPLLGLDKTVMKIAESDLHFL